VRVTTIDGEPRAWRTLSANLSRQGLFVRMPQPLEPGTRVAISLEANGQALPLARGEVRWCRYNPSELDGRFQGCGVRFTEYLHPRANELVDYLVKSLDTGKPLNVAPRRGRRRLIAGVLGAAAASFAAVLVFLVAPSGPAQGPAPTESPGSLAGLAVAAQAAEELSEMVSPALDEAPALQPAEVVAPAPSVAVATVGEGELPLAPAALAPTAAPQLAEPPPTAPVEAVREADLRPGPTALPVTAPQLALAEVHLPPAEVPLAPVAPRGRPSSPANGQVRLPSGAATALTWSASPEGLEVRPALRADSHVARVFALSDPPRLVFDIDGSAPSKSHAMAASSTLITRVRLGKQGTRTRVVLDLASEPHRVTAASDHALVQF